MVPTANLLGFAGQELARKLPKVFGVILETTIASTVEIVLVMVLLKQGPDGKILVIQAAILGSILANLLLCLGVCFFVGGLRQKTQHFDENVSEVGSGLLLVAGMGLMVPSAFFTALKGTVEAGELQTKVLTISRATSILLIVAYLIFVYFQMKTHHSIINQLLEADEERDADKHRDLKKKKLTLTECIVALVIALACVSMHADFLVQQIDYLVEEHGVSDNFLGLILVPLVEKAAEHLTAADEAWDSESTLNANLVYLY
jgi:Ca2+:H+ antiporter